MEEVDSIILHFLRQLNVKVEDDLKNISDLSEDIIIEAACKCITTIDPFINISLKIPSGISHRIEVAAQLASICKDLGYKNEVGYQTFLYSNDSELRQVFMFLIEKLPDESKYTSINVSSSVDKSSFLHVIANKIKEELNAIWIPPSCNSNYETDISKSYNNSRSILPKNDKDEIDEKDLINKLLLIKNKNVDKCSPKPSKVRTGSSFDYSTKINETYDTVEEKRPDTVLSLKELKEKLIVLRAQLKVCEGDRNNMDVEYSQLLKSCEKANADFSNMMDIVNSIKYDTESDVNISVIQKLQDDISMLSKNLEELISNSLSVKVEINKMKNLDLCQTEKVKCKKILDNLKSEAKALKEDHDKKEELISQWAKKYEIQKRGNKRSLYTKRILEIINNVDKQNVEIKNILDDTRELQKETNSLEAKRDRCFSVADETLFKDAKKDDQAKKAYKLLALLHSECDSIVTLVNNTGTLARDIVDLEDNIKTEKAKRTEDSLKKILLDLSTIRAEM